MKVETVRLIYFSPTGTTKKILKSIAKGLSSNNPAITDLTSPKARKDFGLTVHEDIAVIGVPVYAERIPEFLNQCLRNINGNGKPVVLVSIYGNIGYGIALNELQNISINSGFIVAAGAAFVGEHSFCNEQLHVAKGRPDSMDMNVADRFGRVIRDKLNQTDDIKSLSITLPEGRLPLIARILPANAERLVTKTPKADKNSCTKCGVCSNTCPTGAIVPETFEIKEKLCVRCFSCVRKCPSKSRKVVFKKKWIVLNFLRRNGRKRKEPVIYV